MSRVPDEARLLPVTVRFTRPEINRLRAEADKYSVSLSTLVRDRLGVQPAPGVQAASDLENRVTVLEARLAELEQLATPY